MVWDIEFCFVNYLVQVVCVTVSALSVNGLISEQIKMANSLLKLKMFA